MTDEELRTVLRAINHQLIKIEAKIDALSPPTEINPSPVRRCPTGEACQRNVCFGPGCFLARWSLRSTDQKTLFVSRDIDSQTVQAAT